MCNPDNHIMRRKIIPYDPRLKEVARELRKHSTPAEAVLWRHLKGKQLHGFDFHRQKPLDQFIVDFYCHEAGLVIEIDGSSHDCKITKDRNGQQRLESLGVCVLRFQEADVIHNVQGVVSAIEEWMEEHTPSAFGGHPSREGKT